MTRDEYSFSVIPNGVRNPRWLDLLKLRILKSTIVTDSSRWLE
jgi:hypothetical protein